MVSKTLVFVGTLQRQETFAPLIASSHRAPETLRTLFPPAWPLSGAKQSSTNSNGASPGCFQLWISVNDHSTKMLKLSFLAGFPFLSEWESLCNYLLLGVSPSWHHHPACRSELTFGCRSLHDKYQKARSMKKGTKISGSFTEKKILSERTKINPLKEKRKQQKMKKNKKWSKDISFAPKFTFTLRKNNINRDHSALGTPWIWHLWDLKTGPIFSPCWTAPNAVKENASKRRLQGSPSRSRDHCDEKKFVCFFWNLLTSWHPEVTLR